MLRSSETGRFEKTYELTGKVFGNLKVIKEGQRKKIHRRWVCLCSCGKETLVHQDLLLLGKRTECRDCRSGGIDAKNERMSKHLFRVYSNGAKKRNIEFDLQYDDFKLLIRKPCHYCGKFRNRRNSHTGEEHFIFNGLDRIDSNFSYTLDNVVPCCTFCNQAKNNRNKDEFLLWIKDIYNFNYNKN